MYLKKNEKSYKNYIQIMKYIKKEKTKITEKTLIYVTLNDIKMFLIYINI